MNSDSGEHHGILTYIAEISSELADMAARTGHDDLVVHLRTVGEAAAQKVRHVAESSGTQA